MKEEILDILFLQCRETGREDNIKGLLNPDKDTKLFHANGNLDSLGLVRFISDVEEKIADKFGVDILIVDEKAMSRSSSPFISVGTLMEYIHSLLTENTDNE
jgi:acyl carrier protein